MAYKLILLKLKEQQYADAIMSGATSIEAARAAGCPEASIRRSASVMAANKKIQEYIKNELALKAAQRKKETDVDDIWVTQQLKEVYARCMEGERKMVYNRDRGELVQLTDEQGRGVWTFDSMAAIQALVNIGKHIGYYEADNRQKQTIIKVNIQRNNILVNNNETDTEGTAKNESAVATID